MARAIKRRDTECVMSDMLRVALVPGAVVFGGTLGVYHKERAGCMSAGNERGTVFVGIFMENVNNKQKVLEPASAVVKRTGRYLFDVVAPISQNDMFRRVYVLDDSTVGTSDSGTEGPWCGNLVELKLDSDGNIVGAWVDIDSAVIEGRRG